MSLSKPLSTLAVFSILPITGFSQLNLLNQFNANQGSGVSAGEIIAFDPGTDRLFVTSSGGSVYQVNMFGISSAGLATNAGVINFSDAFGVVANMSGLSGLAVDPLGRFGVATLIPTANTTTLGKIGFFNLSTGAVIGTTNVGYHPDSVTFSSDGSRLVVVNEGEFNASSSTNAPGSISVFNVSGINSGNLNTLPSLTGTTKDFSADNLALGVSIAALRNSNISEVGTSGTFINAVPVFNTAAPEAIEPEFASISGDKVYVSLQDNNALAVYDLTAEKWTEVKSLGTITQTIDASDQNNAGSANNLISITQNVPGLPMPDTIGTYVANGKTYVVTANEGDARVDDRDTSRFGDTGGIDNMNSLIDTDSPSNFPTTQTGIRTNEQLGRLIVSRIDGDTDSDGKIDVPTMLGTRSFSIYEQTVSGLVRVHDSGNFFETWIAANGGWQDGRSDDKGPEPEGLVVVTVGGRTFAFIGMERTSHVFMFDVTDPTAPFFVDAKLVSGALRPEGFNFVTAENSPTGTALLFVGFEGDGSVGTEQVAVFSVGTSPIPEPSSAAAMAGLGAIGLAALRRRRRSVRLSLRVTA